MSEPAVKLVRLLMGVAWFLIRLVLLALTGEWIGKRPAQEGEPAGHQVTGSPTAAQSPRTGHQVSGSPTAAQSPQAGVKAKASSQALAQAARMAAWLQSAEARASDLSKRARTTAASDRFGQLVADVVTPALVELRRELSSGQSSKSVVERIQALDDALNALEAGLEARANKQAGSLADSETIAAALVEPLYEYARSEGLELKERAFLAVAQPDAARRQRVALHSRLTLVGDAMGDVHRLGALVRSVARTIVDDLPALTGDLLREYRLPPGQFVPPPGSTYDAESARGALGVWLPELGTEVLATFMLGPAYVRMLSVWVSRPAAPLETRVAARYGRWLSAQPPAQLRMFAATRALRVLGFTEQAEDLERRFQAAHGAPDVLYYPVAENGVVGIPANFVLNELAPVLDALCTEPRDALGDVTLFDVPGFSFMHGESARAADAASRFMRGEASRHAARECAAGALEALLARPDLSELVLAALSRSVRGSGTLEAVGAPVAPSLVAAPRTLAAAARHPGELRAAMMLGAALGARVGGPNRGPNRGPNARG